MLDLLNLVLVNPFPISVSLSEDSNRSVNNIILHSEHENIMHLLKFVAGLKFPV